MSRSLLLASIPLVLALSACKDNGNNEGDDTGVMDDTGEVAVFDPDDPGLHMFLMLGGVQMMGQPMELAAGGFMITAREDFDPVDSDDIPIDTCQIYVDVAPTPECTGPQDCAPEQECVPEYDEGTPIPGSEHCETPREPLNVGPFTLQGANTGPITMQYNPGQSGAYTAPGSDGSLNPGTLAYDTTYTFSGDGDPAQGLGAFSGSVYLADALALTSPAMVDVGMGMMGIEVNPTQALTLQWSGPNPSGTVKFTMAGASFTGGGGTIECLVTDDGEFTIPAEMVAHTELGGMAMLNMLTIERMGTGQASGDGLTIDKIDAMQTLLINIKRVE